MKNEKLHLMNIKKELLDILISIFGETQQDSETIIETERNINEKIMAGIGVSRYNATIGEIKNRIPEIQQRVWQEAWNLYDEWLANSLKA